MDERRITPAVFDADSLFVLMEAFRLASETARAGVTDVARKKRLADLVLYIGLGRVRGATDLRIDDAETIAASALAYSADMDRLFTSMDETASAAPDHGRTNPNQARNPRRDRRDFGAASSA